MSRTLVAYFSASGVTARVAKELAKAADADLYEILPAEPYTDADLNWMNKKSRSSIEMKDEHSRPALAAADANISAYDTVLLGFPIWWGLAPTIVNTFLESYDFSGKRIILFATSGGSGFGRTAEALRPSVSKSAAIVQGRVLSGRSTAESLKSWVASIL